jgi:tetratricopeptide (TPR) repeat protein
MEKETFADKELAGFLDKFIAIKINGDKDKQALKKFAVSGYPTLVFTDRGENVIEKIVGFFPAKSLREKMEMVLSQAEKPKPIAEPPQNIQAPEQGEQRVAEVSQEKNDSADTAQPSPPNNESPDRYHELAHSYEKQGDLEKAATLFRKAVELAPDDWKHRRCFGIFLIRTDNLSEGIRQLERASELNPRDPEVFHQLGHALWKTREYQRSILGFERAIQLAQDNQQYFACAAKAYYLLGLRESNPDLSRSYLKKALYLINKIPYSSNTPGELRDLKFQIRKAYSEAVKRTLPMRSRNH